MKRGTVAALVSAALVAGLALGTLSIAFASGRGVAAGTAPGSGAGIGAVVRQAGGTIADVVAKLTGQPVADVYAARADGKSFAAIADAKGVSAETLTAEVLAARKTALDAAVKAGTVTQTQADAAVANMTSNVSAKITSAAPDTCTGAGPGSGAGGGRGMGRGAGAGSCGGAGCVNQ